MAFLNVKKRGNFIKLKSVTQAKFKTGSDQNRPRPSKDHPK